MIYFIVFFLGVALIGRFTCGFVLLTECLQKKHQVMGGTLMCIGDSIATMYVTFYLRFISNNVHGLIWAGFTINIVSVIAAFWMIESPAWLISAGEIKWAEKEIQYIAKFNGVQHLQIGNIVPN